PKSGCYKESIKATGRLNILKAVLSQSIKAVGRLNILKVVLELDCAILVNRINRKGRDITIIGQCMDKARMKLGSFSSVDVKWAPRCCNKAAGFICNFVQKKLFMGF
ncbi:hypothetical protein Golob_011700, partial [Gossypium lobatum]|nr:hypothetical protein [Gossypium lobatum]